MGHQRANALWFVLMRPLRGVVRLLSANRVEVQPYPTELPLVVVGSSVRFYHFVVKCSGEVSTYVAY